MALTYYLSQTLHCKPSNLSIIRSSSKIDETKPNISQIQATKKKRCLRGKGIIFFGSTTHQGIDGEWSDRSGVIVYKWNEKSNRPNTGSANWKKRWSCCAEYDENAPPCRRGWHVSYDDGFTFY
ncbi:hypothetical protein GH714_003222 [Hevea brasiliensis]|uniref:Uncharacterized protein n=1 Tax=Hevea brasiliensis TaxID=3981 RepID=A0A6A6KYI9_HEVBR|nr:hypothetical protein GH714_003222 [Hevea brasiliensis]